MRTGNGMFTLDHDISSASPSSDIVFEHHEYMEFRYAELLILSHADAHPLYDRPPFSLTAWTVAYPYFDDDSFFESSDATLNAVWKLCQHTIRVTSLDTATDSNTRERLPYEADNYITGLSRLALQREFEWTRPRGAMCWNPTWPTEWRQTVSFAKLTMKPRGVWNWCNLPRQWSCKHNLHASANV